MVKINGREIDNFANPYVIAEIGANHNGDMLLAKSLIKKAKEIGADCVKFQSWTKASIFSKKVYEDNYFLNDDYRQREDYNLEEIVDAYSVSEKELLELKKYCDEVGIDFTSTPFSPEEVDFLVDVLDVPFIKIASMDLNNYPFISYIANKGKMIVLSTGLSHLYEIDKAVETIYATGHKQLILLHCVALYPPEDQEVNLRNIRMLQELYQLPVGFSDHTIGDTASIGATMFGACILEKHFTLDNAMEGWDHKISANPNDMEELIHAVRRANKMLGSYGRKRVESEERRYAFRRSIVARCAIKKGEIFTKEMLDTKRPGSGIKPEGITYILGKPAKKDIQADALIQMDDF